MRIVVLGSRGFPSTYGGYETFIRQFVRYAVEAEHDIVVYCRWREGDARVWNVHGAECRATRGLKTKSLSTVTFGATSFWDAARLDADAALIVNCANGLWLPLLRRSRMRTVINVDGLEWERGKWNRAGRGVFRQGARMAARFADALVADSVEIARIWEREFRRRPAFIPYGAPIVDDESADAVACRGLPLREYGLTVARLVPENNVGLTIDALDRMGAERPPWVVVGSAVGHSELEARLGRAAERPDFWWLGHVSDQRLLTQLWRHCAVYVHGHSVGGTNPALLQAMGAGAPAIAFDTPFSREVLTDEGCFYTSAATLASEIRDCMTSPTLRARLTALGRRRIEEAYSWEEVCARYLALLQGKRR